MDNNTAFKQLYGQNYDMATFLLAGQEIFPIIAGDQKLSPRGEFEVNDNGTYIRGSDGSGTIAALAGGAGSGRSSGRTSGRSSGRTSARRSEPEYSERTLAANAGLTARLAAVNPDLANLNTIANFRSKECPVEWDNRKWIKARGSYAECERRMGFRWVSPTGHCYPEGLCAIPQDDIIENVETLQSEAMLLTTLTQVNNQMMKKERDEFIRNKQAQLFVAYRQSGDYAADRRAGRAKREQDFARQAEDMLPEELQKLPEHAAIVDTELVRLLEKKVEVGMDEEMSTARQAFLQVFSDWLTQTGTTVGTPAADSEVEAFVQDSITCTKANMMFNGPLSRDAIAAARASKADDEDTFVIGDKCQWLQLQDKGLFMPTIVVLQSKGGNPYGPNPSSYGRTEKAAVQRNFQAGLDPLAIAFKEISEKYLERVRISNKKVLHAYSPQYKK